MNRWIHFSFYFTIYDNLAFFFFFSSIFQEWHGGKVLFYCWMLNEIHFHWLEKELSAAFLPCTHLTVTTRTCRGEVFKHFQARVGGQVREIGEGERGGSHKIKKKKRKRRDWQDVPGSISIGWQSEGDITFKLEEHCLLLHFSDIQN